MMAQCFPLEGGIYLKGPYHSDKMEEDKEFSPSQIEINGNLDTDDIIFSDDQGNFVHKDSKAQNMFNTDLLCKDKSMLPQDVPSPGEKEISTDSWQDKDFTFFRSESSPLYSNNDNCTFFEKMQTDMKEKEIEVIEVLSEYSEEKINDDLETGSPVKSMHQLSSKLAEKNDGIEQGPVCDLINCWNENSSKSTMMFQYEPIQVEPSNTKESKEKNKTHGGSKSTEASFIMMKTNKIDKEKPKKSNCKPEEKKNASVLSRTGSKILKNKERNSASKPKTQSKQKGKSKYKRKIQSEYRNRLVQRSGKLMNYKISKRNNMKKVKDEKRDGVMVIEDSISDQSTSDFIIFGDEYGFMLECYSQESGFVDIHEVLRRDKDFAVAGKDNNRIEDIDHVIYPDKPCIHVGKEYQAILPKLAKKRTSRRALCKVWDAERIERGHYDEYMDKLSRLTKIEKSRISEEKAVEALIYNGYSVDRALKFASDNLNYTIHYIECKQLSNKPV